MYKTAFLFFLFAQSTLSSQLKLQGVAISNTNNQGQSNSVASNMAVSDSQLVNNLIGQASNSGTGSATQEANSIVKSNAFADGENNAASSIAQADHNSTSISNNAVANSNLQALTVSNSIAKDPVTPLQSGNTEQSSNNMFMINLNLGLIQTISIKAGNLINIMLPGSPNSGYLWYLNQPSLINLNLLNLVNLNVLGGTDTIISTSNTPGQNANYNFQFNALKRGLVNLNFVYKNSKGTGSPLKILTLKLNIL